MSKVVVNEKDELVKLDNLRIRDREMIPTVVFATNKTKVTEYDANGDVVGYRKTIERVHTVTLNPEEFHKIWKKKRKKVGGDAKKNNEGKDLS